MNSIDNIIKRAVEEANLKPKQASSGHEIKKEASSTGNPIADRLYKLASELEAKGDITNSGISPKLASGDDETLQRLAKTFIYQETLKQASDDRIGAMEYNDIEKLAYDVNIKDAYLDVFEKIAKGEYEPGKAMSRGEGAGIGALFGGAIGGVHGARQVHSVNKQLKKAPGILPDGKMIPKGSKLGKGIAIANTLFTAGIGAGAGAGIGALLGKKKQPEKSAGFMDGYKARLEKAKDKIRGRSQGRHAAISAGQGAVGGIIGGGIGSGSFRNPKALAIYSALGAGVGALTGHLQKKYLDKKKNENGKEVIAA